MPRKKHKARGKGRPLSLTPEISKRICDHIRQTGSTRDACILAGIHPATAHRWLTEGRLQDKGPLRDFFDAVEKARCERRASFHQKLTNAGKKDWRAVAFLAERTEPRVFGLKIRMHVEQELSNALQQLKAQLTPEEYEKCLGILSRASSGGGTGDDNEFPEDTGDEAGDDLGPSPAQPEAASVPRP